MKVTINVKLVNSKFDEVYANTENEGEETEDNIRYLWEDEFDIAGDVKTFKVINNTTYTLAGYYPDNKEFNFVIPDITIVECALENGTIMQLPFSKKTINKTEKLETKKGITFNVFLKSVREIVNPTEGMYILKSDYPESLLTYIKDEEED